MRPHLFPTCLLLLLAACGGQPNDGAAGAPRTALKAAIASAPADTAAYAGVVQAIYIAYFGRPADSGGLAYFTAQFAAAAAPTDVAGMNQAYAGNPAVKALVDSFADSAESRALYPGDDRSVVLAVYQNLFNRGADAAGLAYWSGLIDSGRLTRSSAALAIMAGAVGTDLATMRNKGAAAAAFTDALDTPEKADAYSGLVANVAVRAMLATVAAASDATAFHDTATATLWTLLTGGPAGERADLGQLIFNDATLSEPRGTACIHCHQPNQGFASTNGGLNGVAIGSLPGSVGLRKPMNISYAALTPAFSIITDQGVTLASGGLFWDGRADTPALQALGPLLNPLEMNNGSRQAVVDKVAASPYAGLFKHTFGARVFEDTDLAFTQIGVAIDAFERAKLQPFSSKFDAVLRGRATFTVSETRGMAMFDYESKGNCSACHSINTASERPEDNLFTDFSYRNTGVPRNAQIAQNADPSFFDLGLCGPERPAPALPTTIAADVTIDDFCGKFKVPSLRNVAQRGAFMHNGVFKDLRDVVRFYASRKVSTTPNDLPAKYQRNVERTVAPFNRGAFSGPAMSESEIADVVAFLHTLSDGYMKP